MIELSIREFSQQIWIKYLKILKEFWKIKRKKDLYDVFLLDFIINCLYLFNYINNSKIENY